MGISVLNFGKTKSNEKVDLINLTNNNGMTARITNLGATLVSLLVTPKNGKSVDVVLGFDNLDDYLVNHCYFGAIVGRNCNRIGDACFKINGKTYNLDKNERNKNNLHSGFNGYQKGFGIILWRKKQIQFHLSYIVLIWTKDFLEALILLLHTL